GARSALQAVSGCRSGRGRAPRRRPGPSGERASRPQSPSESLRIDFLLIVEHGDEFLDASASRLGFLRLMDPVQDRVSVLAAERGEELPSTLILVQLPLQVVRNGRGARPWVGGRPPTVGFGAFDLQQTGRLHLAALDQLDGLVAIDLRPLTLAPARRKAQQPVALVELSPLRVDPAI